MKNELSCFAVDIGTTTIVAEYGGKCKSCLNPQSKYGADIITRIVSVAQFGMEAVRLPLLTAIDDISKEVGVTDPQTDVFISANTAQSCFFAGIDPTPLASYPFKANDRFGDYRVVVTREKEYNAYIAPCFSAFVGGDIVVGAVYADIDKIDENILYIDIGTNGEMLLKTPNKLYYAATAAGPAFEGGGISVGVGGVNGAVNHIYRDINNSITYDTIGESEKLIGVCGSGLIDLLALYLEDGVVDEIGNLTDVKFEFPFALTRNDISSLQLAKSALISGIKCLLYAARITVSDVDRVYIAGTLGSNLNLNSMCRVGMLPRGFENKTTFLGNASLLGASRLHNIEFRQRCQEFANTGVCIPLSGNKFFEKNFVDNILFDIGAL